MPAPLPQQPIGIKMTNAPSPSVVVEMFHDVCCPFSNTMFSTIYNPVISELKERAAIHKIEFLFHCVPQPWHSQSCCMNEAVMAAAILDGSKAVSYINEIFAEQTTFFDDNTGDLSRNELYDKLSDIAVISGYDHEKFRSLLSLEGVTGNEGLGDVTQHLKWAVKYHRARAVHVTPTVFVNGLEAPDISSGWSAEEWITKLHPMLKSI